MSVKRVTKFDFKWDELERIGSDEGSFGAMRQDIKKRKRLKSRTVLKKRERD